MCFVLLLMVACGNEEASAGSESVSNGSSDLVAASYDDWDVDGNGKIAHTEFDAAVVDTNICEEWDADDNDYIDETDFSERA